MDLYLIRHADAAPEGAKGVPDDASRPLTELGQAQARDMATALIGRSVTLDAVVTSPMLRAQQTADELLAQFADPGPRRIVFDEIGFEVRPRRIVKFLRKLKGQSVAIVGHQPGLSRLAAWLIGAKKGQLDVAKAGVAKIVFDEWGKGAGTLVWLTTPEWHS